MLTAIRVMNLVIVLGSGGLVGCSSAHKPTAPPPDPQPAAAPAPPSASVSSAAEAETEAARKTAAPVTLTFSSTAKSGTVVLTLTMVALSDIPHGVSRIVVPDGLTVVKGDRQVDLGAVAKGTTREQQLTLVVPATGHFQIFAGMDCRLTPGVSLHKTATPIVLGG